MPEACRAVESIGSRFEPKAHAGGLRPNKELFGWPCKAAGCRMKSGSRFQQSRRSGPLARLLLIRADTGTIWEHSGGSTARLNC